MRLYQKNQHYILEADQNASYWLRNVKEKEKTYHTGSVIFETEEIHPIYEVEMNHTTCYLGQQLISDVELLNFRDLGGYRNEDGRQVKYHCFYRSSPIILKSNKSKKAFEKLHIHTILDLRSEEEATRVKDEMFEGITYLHQSAISEKAFDGSLNMEELLKKSSQDVLKEYMKTIYQNLPFHNSAYQLMFDCLFNQSVPLVFHCSAGKDRTGFAAYLILKTLGVSDELIYEDYLMSNTYLNETNQLLLQQFSDPKGAQELLTVKKEMLEASIEAINKRYASFSQYLKEEYGIDEAQRNRFKELYLYE